MADENKEIPALQEIEDQALDQVEGGVSMLLPEDQKSATGGTASGVHVLMGDGSVRFVPR